MNPSAMEKHWSHLAAGESKDRQEQGQLECVRAGKCCEYHWQVVVEFRRHLFHFFQPQAGNVWEIVVGDVDPDVVGEHVQGAAVSVRLVRKLFILSLLVTAEARSDVVP